MAADKIFRKEWFFRESAKENRSIETRSVAKEKGKFSAAPESVEKGFESIRAESSTMKNLEGVSPFCIAKKRHAISRRGERIRHTAILVFIFHFKWKRGIKVFAFKQANEAIHIVEQIYAAVRARSRAAVKEEASSIRFIQWRNRHSKISPRRSVFVKF